MIKIKKFIEEVIVELPIKTLKFDRDVFDKVSDNIYFLTRKSSISKEIVRQKGNIEELNMGHWMCLSARYQSNFNDITMKSLDVNYLIDQKII
jgi:hypothetical protein